MYTWAFIREVFVLLKIVGAYPEEVEKTTLSLYALSIKISHIIMV